MTTLNRVQRRLAQLRLFSCLLVLAMLLAACGQDTATPTVVAPATATTGAATATVGSNTAPTNTTAAEPAAPTNTVAMAGDPTATTAVAAADDGDPTDDILTISFEGNTTWVRNFGPFAPNNLYPTAFGIYEPMMIFNSIKGELTPWLATEYAWSSDNKTLTFTTRDNVKWSDGTAFSAKDVAYTFNLLNTLFPGAGTWNYLESVSAPDETSVEFLFKQVYTPALFDIGEQIIVPEHIWKDVPEPLTFTNPDPVGTGPFTEVAVFQDQIYQLNRNPYYWQPGKPYIDGIRLPAYASNDAAILASVNGTNDWGNQFIPDIENTYVAKDPENNHYWFPSTVAVPVYVNTTKKPFDDPIVRKAMSKAINRDQGIKIAMNGYALPVGPTGMSAIYDTFVNKTASNDWMVYDTAKANEMLDAAGYKRGGDGIRVTPDGVPMRYEINAVPASTDMVSFSQIIASGMKEIGIEVQLKTYEGSTWYDKLSKGEFDLSMAWTNGGPTPFAFFRGMMGSSTVQPIGTAAGENWQRFGNPEADKLLTEYAATSDPAEQRRILDELQVLFTELVPALTLYSGPAWMEYSTKRFVGWPTAENAYAVGQPSANERLIVLTTIKPK